MKLILNLNQKPSIDLFSSEVSSSTYNPFSRNGISGSFDSGALK